MFFAHTQQRDLLLISPNFATIFYAYTSSCFGIDGLDKVYTVFKNTLFMLFPVFAETYNKLISYL